MEINILDIIKSDLAINFSDGSAVYEVIKDKSPSQLIISFLGIRRISTAFLNESIGKYARENKDMINEVSFVFPEDKPLFTYKINEVIENALLGEDYDHMVDNALLSL